MVVCIMEVNDQISKEDSDPPYLYENEFKYTGQKNGVL